MTVETGGKVAGGRKPINLALRGGVRRVEQIQCGAGFLTHLFEIGRKAAEEWLTKNYDCIGERSTVDIRRMFPRRRL